jgi:hypothetical protein
VKLLTAFAVVVVAVVYLAASNLVAPIVPLHPRFTPPPATDSRPAVEIEPAPIIAAPFVETHAVVVVSARAALKESLDAAAHAACYRKLMRGETEPWNEGVPPQARPGDRVYSHVGKSLSGVTLAYHVVVRPEDDADYARALWRWQDFEQENPR